MAVPSEINLSFWRQDSISTVGEPSGLISNNFDTYILVF